MADGVLKDGIVAGRLAPEQYAENFGDLHPPLDKHEAHVEADRCYFCYDAPCMNACPTSIDIPLFIREISTDNPLGAAETIFEQNILGGMCARVCPTEQLCEEACVREEAEGKPVKIGQLQRYATDVAMREEAQFFERAASTGKHIAVVGAGPAGLACAHRLAVHGHEVTILNSRPKPGGLNEYGIASYKTPDGFAQAEVDYVTAIGGIRIETGTALGRDLSLEDLTGKFDAVFLGIGLGAVNDLRVENELADGSEDAIDFIAGLRQTADLSGLPIGRRVVVIGGGMTAIDAAVQAKLLGAEEVTIAYRRGKEQMNASGYEQDLAASKGVSIRHWLAPTRLVTDGGRVSGIEFEYTALVDGKLQSTGQKTTISADQVFKAIGQKLERREELTLSGGKIEVDAEGRTSMAGVWAGGDCATGGDDLTVTAVAEGRDAAESINRYLMAGAIYSPGFKLRKERVAMADLRNNFVGIKSPNPFWLASAPPTDKAYNVERAFKAGWGGVVWKTLGEEGPPVVNVNGPRYGAIWGADRRLLGLNNIELITDRQLQLNLQEIKQVKKNWPDRALVVSIMVPCEENAWKAILPLVEETEADGIELNFGCPHGMSERGMGSAVGQVPEYVEMVVRWCKQYSRMPVITKLTPNISDIRKPARAAKAGGTDAVSLINTINSITAVNLDTFAPEPTIDGRGSHGGYCGPAVKPIALSMVSEIARDKETYGLPISGIGGITTWRDAAEFIALGAGNVQVCTAAMTYGFKIVEEMISGLNNWMDEKGHQTLDDVTGRAVRNVTDWQFLNLNYVTKAKIDQDLCIKCGRCHIACEDTSHQAISKEKDGKRFFEVMEDECVGCNLCVNVCPVEDCITMIQLEAGMLDERTGKVVEGEYANWTTHPNNPTAKPKVVEPAE